MGKDIETGGLISLKDRQIEKANAEIDRQRELQDSDVLEGDDLGLAIELAIEDGSLTLASLTKVVMDLCENVDLQADLMKKLHKALKITVGADNLTKANRPV
jgi:hypothetical protein